MSELKRQYRDSSNLNARIAIYRYRAEGGFGPAHVLDLMLKTIPADADVLEVGCGPGWMWRGALGRVPRSWRILLTDLMPGMTEEAIAALGNDERFRVRQMDVHTLDLPDASFDAVIANWMLYHVEDRARALVEIRRVIKPGGALFAATNGDTHLGKIDPPGQRVFRRRGAYERRIGLFAEEWSVLWKHSRSPGARHPPHHRN